MKGHNKHASLAKISVGTCKEFFNQSEGITITKKAND